MPDFFQHRNIEDIKFYLDEGWKSHIGAAFAAAYDGAYLEITDFEQADELIAGLLAACEAAHKRLVMLFDGMEHDLELTGWSGPGPDRAIEQQLEAAIAKAKGQTD